MIILFKSMVEMWLCYIPTLQLFGIFPHGGNLLEGHPDKNWHQVKLPGWVTTDWRTNPLLRWTSLELKVVIIITFYFFVILYVLPIIVMMTMVPPSIPYCQQAPTDPSIIDLLVGGENVVAVGNPHFFMVFLIVMFVSRVIVFWQLVML